MGKQTSIKVKHFKSQMGDDDKEREKSQLVHLYPSFWTVTQTQTLCNKIAKSSICSVFKWFTQLALL